MPLMPPVATPSLMVPGALGWLLRTGPSGTQAMLLPTYLPSILGNPGAN